MINLSFVKKHLGSEFGYMFLEWTSMYELIFWVTACLARRERERQNSRHLDRHRQGCVCSCCFARHRPVPGAWNSSSRCFQGWEIGAFLRTSWWWIQVLRLGTAAICTILFASIYDVQISTKLCGCPIWKLPYIRGLIEIKHTYDFWGMLYTGSNVFLVSDFRALVSLITTYNLVLVTSH